MMILNGNLRLAGFLPLVAGRVLRWAATHASSWRCWSIAPPSVALAPALLDRASREVLAMKIPRKRGLFLVSTLISTVVLAGGCARRAGDTASSDTDPKALAEREADLDRREKELAANEDAARQAAVLDARERELAARERTLADARPGGARPSAPVEPIVRTPNPPPSPPLPVARYATVPAGTPVEIEFLDGVSSRVSSPGDRFAARVTHNVVVGGDVAIPAGSKVRGTVTEAVSLKKIGGRAKLGLEFQQLVLPSGGSVPVDATFATVGKSETGRDAATIGGAAAGGAVLGRATAGRKDRDRNTVLGAIVGAAVGTAVASKTAGQEVDIPAGTVIDIVLDQAVEVRLRS